MVEFLIAVLPSAGVLFLFWLGMRALFEADRRERLAQARIERAGGATDAAGPVEPPPVAPPAA